AFAVTIAIMTVRTRLARIDESFIMEQSACQGFCKVRLVSSLGSAARFGNGSSREKPRRLRGMDSGWWYPCSGVAPSPRIWWRWARPDLQAMQTTEYLTVGWGR